MDEPEVGLESVSRALLNRVTHYHAQIGHNVDKTKLYELEYSLLRDAKTLYHSHKWEDALNTFAQVLAIVEKTRSSQDHATRGAIVHNIGSCLHNLGEFDAAQAYYEQAVEAFRKASSPLVDR
jgi:tetratricopeptide (TPR) repeat protein